jgi:uncharacterized Zn finger protein
MLNREAKMSQDRKLDISCPSCWEEQIFVVEGGCESKHGYYCKNCSAVFHAKLGLNAMSGNQVWVAMQLNPSYWEIDKTAPEKGLTSKQKKEVEGIQKYTEIVIMEELSSK